MIANSSLLSLISNASLVVQLIILTLLFASIFSWAFILQHNYILKKRAKLIKDFDFTFWSGIDLAKLYHGLIAKNEKLIGQEAIFAVGFKEFVRLQKQNLLESNLVMESVQRTMKIVGSKEADKLEMHLPFLATVQSTAPYIGLFGTVWGIMHALRELGNVQQATLAMVAPGISEALVATAFGLVAAIPAGIAYNRFTSKANKILLSYELFIEEFTNILYKKVHGVHD